VIKEYVSQGGTLLSDPYFCPYTQHFHLDTEVPGGGYHEVFGCCEDDIYGSPEGEDILYGGEVLNVSNGHFKETFKLTSGKALASYADDSSPAIIENDYEKGSAIISGVNLGLSYSPKLGVGDDFIRNKAEKVRVSAKKIVMNIAQELNITGSIECGCEYIQGGFLLNERENDLLILINNSEEEQKTSFGVPLEYSSMKSILDDTTLDIKEGKFDACFKPLETKVYIVQKSL
jgi:hypothetical protein